MIKKVFVLFFSVAMYFASYAQQTSTKLIGNGIEIIGTQITFDYAANQPSTTVNTITNAFDGNLESIFATNQRSGGWAGLDLKTGHVITKVAYCPRREEPAPRMLLGVFEGANNPDFCDAVPICLITEAPEKGKLTEKVVVNSRGFRYVRYVGPNDVRCNLAELEFYGYESDGDDTHLTQITNIPDVIIHTENAQDITSKEIYIKGIVSIISEDGANLLTDSLEVRGRGNASWGFPKKPYRMKLFNKANVLGLPAKAKNWTLINNYGDKTLLRNLMAFDLSKRFEMPYTPAGTPVNVFLNGEYKGCYQLCDHIQVDKNRVNVEEQDENDIEGDELTGGYLIEIDAYAHSEPDPNVWFDSNSKRIPVTIKSDFVSEQKDYIKKHFNLLESALFASNYKDPVNGYRRYLDENTFIRHFLVGEIAGNIDTYWSTYMYKQRSNDTLFVGPVWDFDLAFDNDTRVHYSYFVNNLNIWLYWPLGSAANGMHDFVNRLLSDAAFEAKIKTIYTYYRDKGDLDVDKLLAVVDAYAEQMDASQKLNFTRWNILNSKVHQNYQALGSYQAEVNVVREYIKKRIAWMDKKLNYVPGASINEINPSNIYLWNDGNTIHIEGLSGRARVRIVDISGRVIAEEKQASNACALSVFGKGLYIVSINDSREGMKSLKCIVN
jgi:hypothetical protein